MHIGELQWWDIPSRWTAMDDDTVVVPPAEFKHFRLIALTSLVGILQSFNIQLALSCTSAGATQLRADTRLKTEVLNLADFPTTAVAAVLQMILKEGPFLTELLRQERLEALAGTPRVVQFFLTSLRRSASLVPGPCEEVVEDALRGAQQAFNKDMGAALSHWGSAKELRQLPAEVEMTFLFPNLLRGTATKLANGAEVLRLPRSVIPSAWFRTANAGFPRLLYDDYSPDVHLFPPYAFFLNFMYHKLRGGDINNPQRPQA